MLARLRQDAGNITTDVRSGSTYTYGYNARGRLATVHQDGNLKGTYTYNSLEQLASRVVTNSGPFNGTIHTTQDRSGNILAEADGTTGVVAKEYIWLPGAGYAGADLPVGVVDVAGSATPELLYVHADHLSRPIRLTDAAKVTAWAVEWLPWGGVHSITGSETLNARFPGQWFQVESGLHYNWHRHYDPTIGRYTQPDPLGFVDGPSVYAYARNAPGEFVDPNGEFAAFVPHVVRWIIGKLAKDAIKKSISPQLSAGDDNSNPSPKPEAEPKPRKRGKMIRFRSNHSIQGGTATESASPVPAQNTGRLTSRDMEAIATCMASSGTRIPPRACVTLAGLQSRSSFTILDFRP